MAQSLTNVIPQVLAQGLVALRENAVMARLINRAYDRAPGSHGSSVDVPIPSAITANAVAPASTPQSPTDLSPTQTTITLNKWYEAAFTLDDQEQTRIMDGVVPMQVTEAARAIANQVDSDIFSTYTSVYGYAGTAGTTPFSSNLSEAINARRELQRNLCPTAPRFAVIDEDAEASALSLENVQRADWSGDRTSYVEGYITRVMGADWHMDQNIPSHTAGTIENGAGAKVGLVTGALSSGASTLAIDHTTLTGTVVEGDVFEFSGHSGTYVVTNSSAVTAAGNEMTGITFSPNAREIVADNETVTFQDDHTINLLFHRDAFALATRPLSDVTASELGSVVMAETDLTSGLTMRLEVTRWHKQDRWSFDILYGVQCIRPALAARIMG